MNRRTQKSEFGVECLPCPFCGYRYRGLEITTCGFSERFECPNCGALGPFPSSKKGTANLKQAEYDRATIEAWNRRVRK